MVDKPDLARVLDYYGVTYITDRRTQKIHCMVHEDAVSSCTVDLDEQYYNCHACGSKGDSLNLIMEKEGIDFRAALEFAQSIPDSGTTSRTTDARSGGLLGHTIPARKREQGRFRPSFRR